MQNVSLDRLRQVANLARSVASALDVDTVLRQVVEAVLSLRPRAFCVVRLVDLERGGYRLAAKGDPVWAAARRAERERAGTEREQAGEERG